MSAVASEVKKAATTIPASINRASSRNGLLQSFHLNDMRVVERAHSVDNGIYQQQPASDGTAAGDVENLDEEHGGYKTPEAAPQAVSPGATLGDKISRVLVLDDLRNAEVWRAAVFESVASFAMTFAGILTTISTLESSFSHPAVAIAILQALILALCVLAAAPATGGHVNPCITFTEMLTAHITAVRATLYILGQTLGSIVASLAAKTVLGPSLALQYSLGGCYLKSQTSPTSGIIGLASGRAFLLEFVLAFFVLFVSYSVALDPPRLPRIGYTLAPFLVGGIVGLCIFAGGNLFDGYGGAGINPGRCIGPAVAMGGAMWEGHWVFWAGPGAAGVVMAGLYWNIPPTHVHVYKVRKAARLKRENRNKSPAVDGWMRRSSSRRGGVQDETVTTMTSLQV